MADHVRRTRESKSDDVERRQRQQLDGRVDSRWRRPLPAPPRCNGWVHRATLAHRGVRHVVPAWTLTVALGAHRLELRLRHEGRPQASTPLRAVLVSQPSRRHSRLSTSPHSTWLPPPPTRGHDRAVMTTLTTMVPSALIGPTGSPHDGRRLRHVQPLRTRPIDRSGPPGATRGCRRLQPRRRPGSRANAPHNAATAASATTPQQRIWAA